MTGNHIMNEYQELYEATLKAFQTAFESSQRLNHDARVDLLNHVQSQLNKEMLAVQGYPPHA